MMGYDFTGGRISHFPVHFCMGLTTVQRKGAACDDVSSPNQKLRNHLGDQPPNEQIHVRLLGLLMCIVLCNLVLYNRQT